MDESEPEQQDSDSEDENVAGPSSRAKKASKGKKGKAGKAMKNARDEEEEPAAKSKAAANTQKKSRRSTTQAKPGISHPQQSSVTLAKKQKKRLQEDPRVPTKRTWWTSRNLRHRPVSRCVYCAREKEDSSAKTLDFTGARGAAKSPADAEDSEEYCEEGEDDELLQDAVSIFPWDTQNFISWASKQTPE